jgi:zinc/manganese transport system substrate-binding protein
LKWDVTPDEFESAVEDGNDPSPTSFAAARDLITQRQVALLVYNIQTQGNVTEALRSAAETAGVPVVEVTETLPTGATYVEWLTKSAQDLAAALGFADNQRAAPTSSGDVSPRHPNGS